MRLSIHSYGSKPTRRRSLTFERLCRALEEKQQKEVPMTYYITLEVHTKKALGTEQQDKLRDAVLAAIDAADREKKIPFGADCATASIGGEEA